MRSLDRKNRLYKKLVLKGGLVVGMVIVGAIERAGIVLGLMRDKIDVSSFQDTLLAPDFGWASLPAALRREKLASNGHSPSRGPSVLSGRTRV